MADDSVEVDPQPTDFPIDSEAPPGLSRRRFLTTAAGAGAAVLVGGVGGVLIADATAPPTPAHAGVAPAATGRAAIVPFEGVHQAGIVRPARSQAAALVAAFDVTAPDRAALTATMRELTGRSRLLAGGWSPDAGDTLYPPPESGVLGSTTGPADLTVTFAVGSSLFDRRYGLADRRPRQLEPMPVFANDVLDPSLSHGDLVVQVCAADELSCVHALRYLMAGTRDDLRLRWMLDGFQRPSTATAPGGTTTRNLMGFKDGTANLSGRDDAAMDGLVWVGADDGEPGWAAGGSYMVVRIIRMFVERWDRTALGEQEKIIGRTKRTGAPLGGSREEEPPDYVSDPDGARVPVDAHIRLANPRSAGTERNLMLRRGYSYSRGFDPAGLLDQGLLFVAFQRDLQAGFVTVQNRLNGEPLEEYIRPIGGGFFYALPGVTSATGYLGEGLLG